LVISQARKIGERVKIGLGTAQFGMEYGAFNSYGQPLINEVSDILRACQKASVTIIDTAFQYEPSEEILGKCLPANHGFRIVTKTPSFKKEKITQADIQKFKTSFQSSLCQLRQPSIYGLLIHHANDLISEGGGQFYENMVEWKQKGLVQKIGASVYTAVEIEELIKRYPLDIIQIPINVFDQRLIQTGHIKELKSREIEIHARSVFLQGLLLANAKRLHPYFESIRYQLAAYHQYLSTMNISKVEGAIHFLSQLDEIDTILVGVDSIEQLHEILLSIQRRISCDLSQFAINDENILNPSRWRIK
jgi:aryl-alcohol dehydrogenase-like predicted oxidoreductase